MDPSGASSEIVQSDIQQQPSEQELRAKEAIEDKIFDAAMKNNWGKVSELYTEHNFLHESKLTGSEDTALHLSIYSCHPDPYDSLYHTHLTFIKKMIESIPEENRQNILKQKNEKGNTPLHLAAELGSVPIIEYLVKYPNDPLIWETNSKGETPLFITAYRGKLQAFLYLHNWCQNEKEEDPLKLCRRKDGNNILHAAISGEYFELAFHIIHYYGPLVNRYNIRGMSPLHFLSRMPQVFRSGNHFRFIDSIIYYCTNVKKLKKKTYEAGVKEDSYHKFNWNLPENYETLVEFLERLWYFASNILGNANRPQSEQGRCSLALGGLPRWWDTTEVTNENRDILILPGSPDTARVTNENKDIQILVESLDTTGVTNENQDIQILSGSPATTGVTNENKDIQILVESPDEEKTNGKLFPANYDIFIKFLKCLMKIVLVVLGIGFERIKKLKERKEKHIWGVQIMKLMIEKEERYKYLKSTGQKPEEKYRKDDDKQKVAPPTKLPNTDDENKEDPTSNTARTNQSPTPSTDENMTDGAKSGSTKETPLLAASKMGIVEMVKWILKTFPIAIQDTDSDEKNLLLLAVEHRQTNVYNWLIGEKYPEYVFYQVDKDENNALHLAAKYQKFEAWRIPGSALQMQGERKWYKYVHDTMPPQSYVRYNKKGQTPTQIFGETHAKLLKDGTKWLVTTATSFSVVATLIATVAFATSATIPGGANEDGYPHLENQPPFDVFSIASLVSLCSSVTALVFFLAILTSRCQHDDFEKDLPRKLLLGLTSLFASITAILVSFCAAHFFILQDKFKTAVLPIYGSTCIPVVFFAFNQFPLYVDLIRSYIEKLPLRSYKVIYTDSSEASSSDQKKECEEDDD